MTARRVSTALGIARLVTLAWAVLLVYCWKVDWLAFQVAVVLPPVFGFAVWLAARTGSTVLLMFAGITFVSHAVAPPFFFINRANYVQSGGFGAVKDFSFGVEEFLGMYVEVAVFVFALIGCAAVMLRLARSLNGIGPSAPAGRRVARPSVRYDAGLILFLIVVAIPQTVMMYEWRQGLTGVVSEPLPYRLTGLMYYSRMFMYPTLIFTALALGRRHLITALVILVYAVIGGLSSSSRYVLFASGAPVVLFALQDRKRVRLVTSTAVLLFAFVVVSRTRDYVYSQPDLSLQELTMLTLGNAAGGDEAEQTNVEWVASTVGGIANRFWGPQDVVLAAQYDVPDIATAIWTYFTLGTVVDDLTYAFYGMTFEAGSGFGVGIGLIPWMVVLARGSWPVLIALAFVVGAMLTVADVLVQKIRATDTLGSSVFAAPVAFFMVYVLYASTLNWFYQLVALTAAALVVLALIRRGMSRPAALQLEHG